MLKKLVVLALALFAVVQLAYAQTARNASPASVGYTRTSTTNLGVTGLDVQGNPGYLALTGVSTKSGYNTDYYLWVNEAGSLCIASWATVQNYSSFPNGSWRTETGMECPKVGAQ